MMAAKEGTAIHTSSQLHRVILAHSYTCGADCVFISCIAESDESDAVGYGFLLVLVGLCSFLLAEYSSVL